MLLQAAPLISSIEPAHVFVSIVAFNDRHFERESWADKKLVMAAAGPTMLSETVNTDVRARPGPETNTGRHRDDAKSANSRTISDTIMIKNYVRGYNSY